MGFQLYLSTLAAVALGTAAPASAEIYRCEDSPFATNCQGLISDNAQTTSSMLVTPGACDSQATVVATGLQVKLSHQWVGDLSLTLVAPDGTEVLLMARPGVTLMNNFGCDGEDVDAYFDDGARTSTVSACADTFPSVHGYFQAFNPLSLLNGTPRNGTWTLRVTDGAAYGFGAVDSWSLWLPCTLPDVSVAASQPTASAGQPGQFTFTRTGDSPGPVTVKYSISGTADASAYTPLDGTVTIAAGETSATVDVVPTGAANGTVVATVVSNVVYAAGAPDSATVTIGEAAGTCGNGTVDDGEECDNGADNGSDGVPCSDACKLVDTGDGGCCNVNGGPNAGSLLGILAFVGLVLVRRRKPARGTMLLALLVGARVLGSASSADAAIGTLDNVPSATLLYPYFEVDTGAGTSDTIITVQNTNASSVLMNVTVWSELGVPVHHFPVYLTGYDQESISLRELIVNGKVPHTASNGQDLTDTISPQGPMSQDINFASCTGQLPAADLSGTAIANLKAALTGQAVASLGNQCASSSHGDTLARGYVTVDTVNNCTSRDPSVTGYFASDTTNQNYLMGDFFFVDAANAHAQAQPAVHIEASSTDARTSTSGRYTFYGRYVGWNASDNREPLATQWQVPYTTKETDIIVWRDSKVSQSAFACGSLPSTYPLGSEGLFSFDMQEGVTDLSVVQPFTTNVTRVRVGSAALPVTSKNGTIVFSSNTGTPSQPPFDQGAAQSFAMAIHYPGARHNPATKFGTNVAALAIDSAARATHQFPSGEYDYDPNTNTVVSTMPLAFGVSNVAGASTVLAPYFEVDPVDPNGINTQIRLVNLYPSALLVHATLWTDYGIPTHRFNIYLTGFDSSTVDLRWLFQKGLIDRTASAGQDPTGTISPKGNFSQDINFASCNGQLPAPRLSTTDIADLVSAHSGKASTRFGGRCSGSDHGDSLVRGYVTFDLVNNCTTRVASDPGYMFDLTDQNNLSGTYTIIDRHDQVSVADTLVHIQSSSSDPAVTTAGNATFYGKFNGWNATDHREPLGTAWQSRYIDTVPAGSPFAAFADGKTSFIVWRESPAVTSPFTCGSTPAGFPLPLREVLELDDQEHVTSLSASLNPFPIVSQRVSVESPDLAIAYGAGFITADLRAPVGATGGPTSDPSRRGSFMTSTHTAKAAGYEVLLGGMQLR